MVEIRDIPNDELPPEDVDCVLIEKSGSKFIAKGSVGAPNDPTFYNPPAFPTLEAAIEASMAWAAMNDVPSIYITGRNVHHSAQAAPSGSPVNDPQ
jgi:hypothetical protein